LVPPPPGNIAVERRLAEIIDENVAVERWEEDDDDVDLHTSSEDELIDPADEGW
jgi:hypothetical protein